MAMNSSSSLQQEDEYNLQLTAPGGLLHLLQRTVQADANINNKKGKATWLLYTNELRDWRYIAKGWIQNGTGSSSSTGEQLMTRETGESLPYFSSITCRSENQSKHIGPIKYRCEGSSSVYRYMYYNELYKNPSYYIYSLYK